MNRIPPSIITILIILGALAARIAYVQITTNKIEGDYPVKEISIRSDCINIYPAANVQTDELIDLRWFGTFKPRMTIQDALDTFGNPDNIKRNDEQYIIIEYWVDGGRIEVCEFYSADGSIDRDLVYYPKSMHYSELLNPQISKHVDPKKEVTYIYINNSLEQLQAIVEIIGNRIESLTWTARDY